MVAKIKFRVITDYLVLFLLLFTSGFAFVVNSPYDDEILLGGLAILAYIAIKRNLKLVLSYWMVIGVFVLLSVFQHFKFGGISINAHIGVLVKITLGYLAFKLLEGNFIDYYIKTIKFIAGYSLIFFTTFFLFPSAFDFVNQSIVPLFNSYDSHGEGNFFLYVMDVQEINRNAGPFWEPGAFQGYLNLALFLSFSKKGGFYFRSNYILILALLSTMSTTGYLVFLIQLMLFMMKFSGKNSKYLLILPLGAIIAGYVYFTVPILNEKITEQIEAIDTESPNTQRFNSFLRDLNTFSENSWIGTGPTLKNRYGTADVDEVVVSTTGITNLLASYGVIGFLLYLIAFSKGSKRLLEINETTSFAPLIFFSIFLLISMSEGFPFQPFFLGITTVFSAKNFKT